MPLAVYDQWSRLVSAGVGPIIVISACGLLTSAFYNRLTQLITRLRSFQRERLAEQEKLARTADTDPVKSRESLEMLGMLRQQTTLFTRRARLIRRTLFCLLCAIAAMVVCGLSLGLTAIVEPMVIPAAVFFVLGLASMLTALVFAGMELAMALDPIILESQFVATRLKEVEGV